MDLGKAITDDLARAARSAAQLYNLESVLAELLLLGDIGCFASYNQFARPMTLGIYPKDSEQAESIMRGLLPKVGKFDKDFDGATNRIHLTGRYKGVAITIKMETPATCTVERIEETVDVPAQPATTEKRVRYVLKGDCDPLLTQPPEVTEKENADHEQTQAADV